MAIEIVHFLSGVAMVGVIGLIFRRRLTHPIFYLWATFTFMLPDLAHLLFWNPEMLSSIFPRTLEDLFEGLFSTSHPFLLHSWLFPAIVAAISLYGRHKDVRQWKYLAILAEGWAVHLAFDGVMLF